MILYDTNKYKYKPENEPMPKLEVDDNLQLYGNSIFFTYPV